MILKAWRLQDLNFVLWVLAVQRYIGFVECQLVAPCALTCITSTDGCSIADYECLCTNSEFINHATICINANCLGGDLTNAEASLQDNCKAVGVTLPTSATTSIFSSGVNVLVGPTSDFRGFVLISKSTSATATPPLSSSTVHPSGSTSSGDAAPATNEPGATVSTYGTNEMGVPVTVIVGVLSSVGVLIFGTVIGLYLLRRRRTRRVPIANQSVVVSPMTPYMLPASRSGRSLERQLREDNLDPFKSEEDMNIRSDSIPPVVKSNIGPRNGGLGEEAVEWMRQMSEIREEVARLRQLLISSNQSDSNIPIPDQTAQLSEMREEIQRLRHLLTLQPTERRGDFDGVSRTTSLPEYEC